jgi:hypothetical protein
MTIVPVRYRGVDTAILPVGHGGAYTAIMLGMEVPKEPLYQSGLQVFI